MGIVRLLHRPFDREHELFVLYLKKIFRIVISPKKKQSTRSRELNRSSSVGKDVTQDTGTLEAKNNSRNMLEFCEINWTMGFPIHFRPSKNDRASMDRL